MRTRAVSDWPARMVLVLLMAVSLAAAQAPRPGPLDAAFEAAEKAALEKAAADRHLTEKTVALKTATTTGEAVAEALKKAAEAKLAAERVGAADAKAVAEKTVADLEAQGKLAKAAVEKATVERNTAAKVVQNKATALAEANKKLTAERAAAEKTSTDANKAAGDALVARETAANVLNQKTPAANQTANTAAASQAAAAKLEAERAAAEKAVTQNTNAANAAATAVTASQAAADQAASEKAGAEKAAADKTAAAKAATKAAAKEQDPARKKTLIEAAAKAGAEKTAAEKSLADKLVAIVRATEQAAAQKATLAKITADKAAAEKLLSDKTHAARAAADKAAADKAAADKATAERAAAENDLAVKIVAEKSLRHRAAEARAVAEGGLKVIPESAWDYASARHLLVRAGFGGTPEQVARLHDMGLVEAVNYLVDYAYHQPTDDIRFSIDPPERPVAGENRLSPPERERLNQRRDHKRNTDFHALRLWWMRRLVESPRPLQEKMTLFWHGHFATEWQKIAWPHLMCNQNQLFREHAVGNLGALLYGIVHDPAMIVYLDNQVNHKGHPNQNLARELMELFAMGVNQGYTEYDIREGARALTGYSYEHYTGQFRFNLAQHDTDPKTLFGQTGSWTGDDIVTLILQQPHTARFIAGKLFEYFAYPDPAAEVVSRLAIVLRSNQYELAPLLKNLFMSEEFYSPRALGTQIKGPVQLLVGLLRDFGVKGADYNALVNWCADMGQELFQPPNVKGWYGGRDWVNANLIFMRYNYLAALVRSVPQPNNQRGLDLVGLLESKGQTTPDQAVDYLARCCLLEPLNEDQRRELLEYLGTLPPSAEWAKHRDQLNNRLRQVLILMLTTPEYQMA